MSASKFRNANGTLTAYAFACGYIESFTIDGKEYYATDAPGVALYRDGATWHVKAHSAPHGGDRVWNSFDTLTEARQAFRAYRSAIKKGIDVVAMDN